MTSGERDTVWLDSITRLGETGPSAQHLKQVAAAVGPDERLFARGGEWQDFGGVQLDGIQR